MGTLALAAKITHVPSMYLSELDGPRKGFRQAAIDGHVEIGRRCRELGVEYQVGVPASWVHLHDVIVRWLRSWLNQWIDQPSAKNQWQMQK